jgi:hypothetical protein
MVNQAVYRLQQVIDMPEGSGTCLRPEPAARIGGCLSRTLVFPGRAAVGLGLQVHAAPSRKSCWPWSRNQGDAQALAEAIVAAIDEPALRGLAGIHPSPQCTEVFLHPAAENLQLEPDGRGGIVCSAKTSTCGPGFHAFVVDLLERAGQKLGLAWTAAGDRFSDETGYWTERSLEKVQHEMAGWLHSVSAVVLEQTDVSNLAINMPFGFPMPHDDTSHFALTPMGPRTREWFELAAQSHADAARLAPAFFPWWNRGLTGDFWRGLGLVMAWGNLTWTIPQDDEERASYQLVQHAFRRAREAGASGLPTQEMAEIDSLLAMDEDAPLPVPDRDPERIGYRRWRLDRPLTGHWLVALPGYYFKGEENDGQTTVFWYGDRTVRGSSLAFERRDGRIAPAAEMVADLESPADAEVLDERQGDPPGWAVIERKVEDGEVQWELIGRTGAPNEICLTSIYFADKSDRQWAVETWRSIFRRPDDTSI